MKKPINPIIIASLIILVGIVFYALSNRYYIDTSTRFVIDRLTGKVARIKIEELSTNTVNNPITINQYRVKGGGILEQTKRNEYLGNLNLLQGSEDMMNVFRDYYNNCIDNIKKDPLYYNEKWSEFDFNELKKYGPLLSPPNIAIVYSDDEISDPDKYINYLKTILDQ